MSVKSIIIGKGDTHTPTVNMPSGNVLVVNGMSIMRGFGGPGVTVGNGFTSKLASIRGLIEVNNAVENTTIDDLISNPSLIPTYDSNIHRAWLWGDPINDNGFKTSTVSQYATKAGQLLDLTYDLKGWPKEKMYPITGFLTTEASWAGYGVTPAASNASYYLFQAALAAVCAAFGVPCISVRQFMETYIGASGLDIYGHHPLDTKTLSLGAYVSDFIL